MTTCSSSPRSSLQRAEPFAPESVSALGPRKSSHGHDPSDHARATTEATGNLDLANALIDLLEDAPLQGPQDRILVDTHTGE